MNWSCFIQGPDAVQKSTTSLYIYVGHAQYIYVVVYKVSLVFDFRF